MLTVDKGFEVRYGVAMSVDVDLSTQRSTERLPLQLLLEIGGNTVNTNSIDSITPVVLFAIEPISKY